MSVSDHNTVAIPDDAIAAMSDRELLEGIYRSVRSAEEMIAKTVAEVGPTVEAFSRGGLMGLLGRR